MTNILLVYKEEYPWDVRVEKLSLTFREKCSSHILARNNKGEVRKSLIDGVTIHRIGYIKWLPKSINRLLQTAFWFNPMWIYTFSRVLWKEKIDLIVVRDIPLAPMAILFGKILGKKIILDMAECYPLMYESISNSSNSITNKIFKNPTLARVKEAFCLRYVDHVWTMIKESEERLLSLNVPRQRISIVSNTPLKIGGYSERKHEGSAIRIVYVGFLTKLRGLDLIIQAVYSFVNSEHGGNEISLDIIGKGEESDNLALLIEKLGLKSHVRIHGWLEHCEAEELMQKANIGALTYRRCPHWNHTIPNKIFDYMKSGIPIITTNIDPINRIVKEEICGLMSSEDPNAIGLNLITLKDSKLREHLSKNGQAAITSKYNWEAESETINRTINNLI